MEIDCLNIDSEECIYCYEPIKEISFENKPYILVPNCYCNYNIHYQCLLTCLHNKNQCLYCYKPFQMYKNKKYRPKRNNVKKLLSYFSLSCC